MPQMAPLMWLYLFFFFITTLMLFITITYFIKPFEKIEVISSIIQIKEKSWKW
uniref:ATP synthase complex subunit 8 n=1 Tax=Orithyia sinica TaxID=260260 RepID=A0A346RN69_9EUCA|nr:ATP synthase F0 subunit 8 [Orithyia sinica]AXS67516.1 ATP synthase F0 subunit 8 [Orithyia sinica]